MLLTLIWTMLVEKSSGTIVKCCARSEIFLAGSSSCGESQTEDVWRASSVYKVQDGDLVALAPQEVADLPLEADFLKKFSQHRLANCSDVYMLDKSEKWKLVEGGLLHHQGYGLTTGYCVDHMLHPDGHLNTFVLRCQEVESNTTMVKEECLNTQSSHLLVIFTVLGVISLVFLLVTLVVYVTVPDLFNLHGKIVVRKDHILVPREGPRFF